MGAALRGQRDWHRGRDQPLRLPVAGGRMTFHNPHRTVRPNPLWPFGRCECCGKPTMYDCTVCGQCATEANTNRMRRPWRRCSACWGVCHWHDEAWVCDDCGSEWYPEHGQQFAAPEPTKETHEQHQSVQ